MKNETARREIESLDYYLQNHTTDYSEESHMAMMMAIKALEKEPCEDCISRQYLIERATSWDKHFADSERCVSLTEIQNAPSVTPNARWIPVSERLPKDLQTVNVTWVNHEPEPYYHDIKDKSFVATAIFSKRTGHWYWYSTTCADYLGEYGENEIDKVDDAIEIVAWQPLPQLYKAESEDNE